MPCPGPAGPFYVKNQPKGGFFGHSEPTFAEIRRKGKISGRYGPHRRICRRLRKQIGAFCPDDP